jgi:FlaA1/EpsC-like NDP-sugar epimerase
VNLENFKDKEILITGGTGSLGQTLVKLLLTEIFPRGIRLYSRDEAKHWVVRQKVEEWKKEYPEIKTPVAYLVGDIRDKERLSIAMDGVNIVINTAAMKHVPFCEDNPTEAVNTNINGTMNVIFSALKTNSVEKVFHIGTDKNCSPLNLYGATKLVAEKLIINANTYSHGTLRNPKFFAFRYGNILGSKGSVIQLFREQLSKKNQLTITDIDMTRFWITLERVARFILLCINNSLIGHEGFNGGEIFVPQMPSASILEIANIISPDSEKLITGMRKGEKLHELMINWNESCNAEFVELPNELKDKITKGFFIIHPNKKINEEGFTYSSYSNPWKLDKEILTKWINDKYAY